MPFTAEEVAHFENSVIEWNVKDYINQTVQDRPMYDALLANKKTFPAGKEFITMRVSGEFVVEMIGYTHDDEQAYVNPATLKQAKARWYEVGSGTNVTLTELKKYGVSVVDSNRSNSTVTHTDSELAALVDVLEYKEDQLMEGSERSLAQMFWRDGTQDAKAMPGIFSVLVDSPTTGVRLGIDSAIETYWRNRVSLGIDSSTASNQNLVTKLQTEFRQLRRFSRLRPQHVFCAGSDFMDALEQELRAKGNYTEVGWAKNGGSIDFSVADMSFKGLLVKYDPTLDDLSRSKFGYVVDMRQVKLWCMDDEWMKRHNPSRPPEKYVKYDAVTCTIALCVGQMNTSGVYSIA